MGDRKRSLAKAVSVGRAMLMLGRFARGVDRLPFAVCVALEYWFLFTQLIPHSSAPTNWVESAFLRPGAWGCFALEERRCWQ